MRPLQCGLLAEMLLDRNDALETLPPIQAHADRRLFFNVTTPSSIFICGSQGPKKTYQSLNVSVEPLQIDSHALNTKRVLDLMAVKPEEGSVPLYVHTVNRILREMRMSQQATGTRFDYQAFKEEILAADLSPAQLAPLSQRLAMLESFMPQTGDRAKGKHGKSPTGTSWKNQPGLLTIVDLSCPCVSPETACSLFNICLSLFLEQSISCGRVVALDEAHKYMTGSPESAVLTNTLLSTVRLQRHLGARIFVSTQEPTIAPAFLDLCTVTLIHRFSSPAWLRALGAHIALMQQHDPVSVAQRDDSFESSKETAKHLFEKIVRLETGEAFVFAPSATVAIGNPGCSSTSGLTRSYIKVKIRSRLSEDGPSTSCHAYETSGWQVQKETSLNRNAGFPDFGSVAVPPTPSCFVSPGGDLDFVNCATLCADIMSRARGCQQCGLPIQPLYSF
ncbi:p-loop containing nucleoside triphosphate hydrolase [Stemphylium lycopersici]|nr:p-loop containing nucleoside triphosphate hydrolase [Stemphylium lycopersici]